MSSPATEGSRSSVTTGTDIRSLISLQVLPSMTATGRPARAMSSLNFPAFLSNISSFQTGTRSRPK